jgi:hypothetical protein
MNACSTFAERLFFAITCVLGWVVFPMFILASFTLLLVYALIAEIVASISGAVAPIYRNDLAARRMADRLSRSLRP